MEMIIKVSKYFFKKKIRMGTYSQSKKNPLVNKQYLVFIKKINSIWCISMQRHVVDGEMVWHNEKNEEQSKSTWMECFRHTRFIYVQHKICNGLITCLYFVACFLRQYKTHCTAHSMRKWCGFKTKKKNIYNKN